ncbi:hypothetical protein ANCDUO_25718 [Ancylostoma duodenale]|uniref:Uncharacterized protein n=1 Tax=Ancylostoma duodenale TaxID=51022 RepID=A0A0C2C3L4_9BILA|nr:hypothetical protein ANCDUO_25718 [Ancylostoma duodenale]
MWGIIVHHIRRKSKQYNTVNDLREAIVEPWDHIDDKTVKTLKYKAVSTFSIGHEKKIPQT